MLPTMSLLTMSEKQKNERECTMKSFLLAVICMVLLLGTSGCGESRYNKLVGSWQGNDHSRGTMTLNADGTMSSHVKTGSWGILVPSDIYISGNWRLSEDSIILEVTSSTYNNSTLSGVRLSEKIVNIDSDTFITIDSDGETQTYRRIR